MAAFVIDTNVLVAANGRSHADPACVLACLDVLQEIRNGGLVVMDDGMRILREYLGNVNRSGQPGPGDAFAKWVWESQADERSCERVILHSRFEHGAEHFAEFPDDPDLVVFDLSDRKFVAVALASANYPDLLNALDSDWAENHKALTRNGLRIRFLCPQHVRAD